MGEPLSAGDRAIVILKQRRHANELRRDANEHHMLQPPAPQQQQVLLYNHYKSNGQTPVYWWNCPLCSCYVPESRTWVQARISLLKVTMVKDFHFFDEETAGNLSEQMQII